ncbi:MAG: D-tyrosyl-tRNA(Tyr) deacylase [Paludibacteraceae bacterium]|nr:D-tyrosyl-tRNA(Tyr) deacylase [Paludibacteraceae bacterium]
MKVIVQRALNAAVTIDGSVVGQIAKGFVLLVGVTHSDTEDDARYLAKKVAGMRIMSDAEGKMNLTLADVGGEVLSVSQFTLYGDCRKGNRPSFIEAARPEQAEPLYNYFNSLLRETYGLHVETGVFGADMQVSFTNDGPVTIILDSANL